MSVPEEPRTTDTSRRTFLTAGLGGLGGVALGSVGGWFGAKASADPEPGAEVVEAASDYNEALVATTFPLRGHHQPGIATIETNFSALVAFDLNDGQAVPDIIRMMRIWTDSAERLMAGQPSLTDTEPELAVFPAMLTVTLGLGPGFFDRVEGLAASKPSWLKQLPAFEQIDALEDQWSEGDIALLIQGEDPLAISHAQRVLTKDIMAFAQPRYVQSGFRNTSATWERGRTMRNLFGQVDGTSNVDPVNEPELVFVDAPDEWMDGGSTLVVRRIAMNLDTWDELDRPAREASVGRDLATGAPLTGGEEFDPLDLDARNDLGFTLIDPAAHARRAQTGDPTQRMYRRPYNYDLSPTPETLASGQLSNAGLVFMTFQADVDRQFIPVQAQLAELDMLNTWTTPIGSAVFAIPGGLGEDEPYFCSRLLEPLA